MHDTFFFEISRIPAVFIATTEFMTGAVAQATALGMPELRRVYVRHPVQNQTDAELQAQAEVYFDELIAALVD